MKFIDITRTLAPEMAVWDGDEPFQLTKQLQLINGDSVNLTRIMVSAHMGTHVDAPYHFAQDGLTMEAVPLEPYWGLAQVVTVGKTDGPLTPADFDHVDLTLAPRLIVNTKHSTRPMTQFYRNFAYPTPALADLLGQKGVILYGTDGPSMDFVDEPTLPGHHALRRNNVYILEGLDLRQAPDGLYELSAFPLKIAGGDGSPVRAVLRTLE
jgi:arylformamidase